MTDQKDTIYIDIDDEITGIIDKVQGSPKKVVALVLPKRATVLQSIVNMKLLKRTADQAGKHIALITSESALLPLAGAVGLHVAKTPQSKPEIPPGPNEAPTAVEPGETIDPSQSVGSLAGIPDDDDSIEVDNSETAAPKADKDNGKKSKKAKKDKSGKKLKIPNFEKFRTKLLIGIAALIALIVLLVLAFVVLPKATITLQTDTSNLDTNLTLIADPTATTLDEQNMVLPSLKKEFRKTDTEKVAATGKKDLGTKALGEVTLSLVNCDTNAVNVPAGTTVTTGSTSFVTQDAASLQSVQVGNQCQNANFPNFSTKTVKVVAAEPGDQYNVAAGKTFTTAGYSAVSGSNANAMAGGTSKIVKIVTKEDVDAAKAKILDRNSDEAPKDLEDDIREEGYYPLKETLSPSTPTVSSSPNVGEEAAEVTVTSTAVYTMLGVKEDDLKKLIENDAKKRIDTSKQVIRDNGLSSATIKVEKKDAEGKMTLALNTIVIAGPDLDEEAIKKEIAGKKRGEVQEILKGRPGINEVEVAYSPFWVQSTPKSTSKIKLVFESSNNGNANNP